MKRSTAVLVGLSLVGVALAAQAGFSVKEAADTCANAHAVLVASRSGKHDYIWREIRSVVREGNGKWLVVDDYEPMVVQKISLRQYELKYHGDAAAYVVHCGHGGTCNSLAQAFFKKHDDWYSPEVFCGAIPEALINPSKVSR